MFNFDVGEKLSDYRRRVLNSTLNSFLMKNPGYKIIYISYSGSFLHGTATENSDLDIKGLFIPSVDSVLLSQNLNNFQFSTGDNKSSNGDEDIDIELFSIYQFFHHLNKCEIGSMDLLFSLFNSDTVIFSSIQSEYIKDHYQDFLTKNSKSFLGFAFKQVSLYRVKSNRLDVALRVRDFINEQINLNPKVKHQKVKDFENFWIDLANNINDDKLFSITNDPIHGKFLSILGRKFQFSINMSRLLKNVQFIIDEYGNRVSNANKHNGKSLKAISHAFRALFEAEELFLTGFITFPSPKSSFLLNIKTDTTLDIESLLDELEVFRSHIEDLELKSSLPRSHDKNTINRHILHLMHS